MKHKHCDVIKAWADGAVIEHREEGENKWSFLEHPGWMSSHGEYRVKPSKPITGVVLFCDSSVVRGAIELTKEVVDALKIAGIEYGEES